MKTEKRLGIWMDHSIAHLMEFSTFPIETSTSKSTFTHAVMEEAMSRSERVMHNKEHGQETAYYNLLGNSIKQYNHVVLFGPTEAKIELHNILKNDHHFDKIKIEVRNSDKLTENQQHAFVKEFFTTHLLASSNH